MKNAMRGCGLALALAGTLLSGCTETEDDGPFRIDYAVIVGGDGAGNEGLGRSNPSDIYPDDSGSDLELHWQIEQSGDPQYSVSWFLSDDQVIDDSDEEIFYSGCGSGLSGSVCPDDAGDVLCSFDTNDVLDCGPVYSTTDLTSYFTAHGGLGRYYLIMEANDAVRAGRDSQAFEVNFY